jgi:hypothetical protein
VTRRAAQVGTRPRGTLRILEQRVYRGPNFWSYDPTIKLIVDLGELGTGRRTGSPTSPIA